MIECVCGERFPDGEQGLNDLAMHIHEEHMGKSYFTGSDGGTKHLKVDFVAKVKDLPKC